MLHASDTCSDVDLQVASQVIWFCGSHGVNRMDGNGEPELLSEDKHCTLFVPSYLKWKSHRYPCN